MLAGMRDPQGFQLDLCRVTTVAFLFVVIVVTTLTAGIIGCNISPGSLDYLTTCHGDWEMSLIPFYSVAITQIVLTVLQWHKKQRSPLASWTTQSQLGGEQFINMKHFNSVSSSGGRGRGGEGGRSLLLNNEKISNFFNASIEDLSSEGKYSVRGNQGAQEVETQQKVNSFDGIVLHVGNKANNLKSPASSLGEDERASEQFEGDYDMCLKGVHWNNLWMACYYGIFFLAMDASLNAWDSYSSFQLSSQALETCQHLVKEGSTIPYFHSIFSKSAFTQCFGVAATAMLLVRKFRSPFFLKNYFVLKDKRRRFRKVHIFYCFQGLFQWGIFGYVVFNLVSSWLYGFGTPIQIISSIFLAGVSLWVASVLTHILEVDFCTSLRRPKLSFHWLWSIVWLFIVWLCGFIFYVSTKGIAFNFYLIPHFVMWAFFLILTYTKFKTIFGSYGAETLETNFLNFSDQSNVLTGIMRNY